LAVIFTNLKLKPTRKPIKISCGTCTCCVDACPTGAIIAPGVIDSNKCISYHTIENRNEIPESIAKKIHETKRIFGCDICQEACPHNLARQKSVKKLPAKIAGDQLSLKSLAAIKTDQQFLTHFAGSPLMRAKRRGLQRFL
jgi:epoxyqueuosine reductase